LLDNESYSNTMICADKV